MEAMALIRLPRSLSSKSLTELLKTVLNSEIEVAHVSDLSKPESFRGVAAGKLVPMLGSVALRVCMLEVGENAGLDVLIRFEVCKAGSTDWVGFILGARALDCVERGGLGHTPAAGGHAMGHLGIVAHRPERPCAERAETYPHQNGSYRRLRMSLSL
jgi:hypothetical protein